MALSTPAPRPAAARTVAADHTATGAPAATAAPTAAAADDGHANPSTHEDSAGLKLIAAADEPSPPPTACAEGAPVRHEEIVALALEITLNRYGDFDPQGRMYARASEVERVRDEERRNAAARAGQGEVAVSSGLQGDAIQPLVLRARAGECLRITLTNQLPDGEAASLQISGAGLRVVGSGGPAGPTNPRAFAAAGGGSVTYEWAVPQRTGTHYLRSGGDERALIHHGLFGAVVIEPPGSTWTDPRTGAPATGWDAVVSGPKTPAFREYALIYHEVGDETFQVTTRDGSFAPLVDPLTEAYRPGSRALNYRSEPFGNRLALGQAITGRVDKSLAYSSYSYGDPATPLMRAYLGEPTVQRVVHGGSEVFHVHHVHGGSVRWPRQLRAEPPREETGLRKQTPLVPTSSERTDSQTVGPAETFDVVDECGAGGCQQSAGDFLYHCHIAHHYFAGMWGVWRVYNTLQDGPSSTDSLPPLPAVAPDGPKAPAAAVPAAALAGTTVDNHGRTTAVSSADLEAWVSGQLPPPGVNRQGEASLWDWQRDGASWRGEPETSAVWPGYRSAQPGARPELLFDPRTGRLAFPFLRPHLAARPPFAPNHGPSPHLDPAAAGAEPAAPGASGPASLCPDGTRVRRFDLNAVAQPVPVNPKRQLVDGNGQLFVLRSQRDRARTDPTLQVPLALRANAGEDCVDVLLRSELPDDPSQPLSKVGAHIHFVQFDVQASDGLDAGFNYEQTVRPYASAGAALTRAESAGSSQLALTSAERFPVGTVIGIGMDRDETFETRRVVGAAGATLRLDRPTQFPHDPGEIVSAEFVRYRWFPDAQFGTSYFHDHVDAIHSWSHGLFGALIAEPPGSTYTDPRTGEPLVSGPVADIHPKGPVAEGISGSFRELALFIQDDIALNAVGRSTGSAFGMRAEPLDRRKGPTDEVFSSERHGDPATSTVEANLGDPVVVRSLVGSTNDVHTVHVDGHVFRTEPWSKDSAPVSTVRVGISERFDLAIPAAGGPQRQPGDYLYYSGRPTKLREGSWGLVRVYGPGEGEVRPLPDRDGSPRKAAEPSTRTCPAGAPVRDVAVTAIEVPLPMLDGATGKIFVLDRDRDAVESGRRPAEPLVVHANVGDCITLRLRNATTGGPVSYHCDLLSADPSSSAGVAAGHEPAQSVAPGASRTYTLYASPEVGETVSLVRDFGDVTKNPGLGLYGAIVIGAKGTTYRGQGTQVVATPPGGDPYRDVTLFFQDEDDSLGSHRMPYAAAVSGPVGINYQRAPLGDRPGGPADRSRAYAGELPPTSVIDAVAGDPLRIHVVAPWSEQTQVLTIDGHQWPVEPGMRGSNVVGATALGGLEALTIRPVGGAGGVDRRPGAYVYGAARTAYREAGVWGLLRVHAPGESVPGMLPLKASSSRPAAADIAFLASIAAALVATALVLQRRRRAAPAPRLPD